LPPRHLPATPPPINQYPWLSPSLPKRRVQPSSTLCLPRPHVPQADWLETLIATPNFRMAALPQHSCLLAVTFPLNACLSPYSPLSRTPSPPGVFPSSILPGSRLPFSTQASSAVSECRPALRSASPPGAPRAALLHRPSRPPLPFTSLLFHPPRPQTAPSSQGTSLEALGLHRAKWCGLLHSPPPLSYRRGNGGPGAALTC
jgi:hypothetical protein